MKLRHHKPKDAALVGGLMLVMACLAPCELKQTDAEKQTVARVEKRIEEAYDLWCSKGGEPRWTYHAALRKILETLSEDEVRLVAQHVGFESEKEAYRMWAKFDPAGALKAIRAFEDSNADEIKLAGTGLEGGPGQAIKECVAELYLGAIDGWAEVAPKTAWESFRERKGSLSKSLVIGDFVCSFDRVLCEHLAKVDPDRAFNELIGFHSDDFEEMRVASMLGGYLRSAPRGRDWRKEAEQLLERRWKPDYWLYAEMQTSLMGRWLQDDAKAAEKWFHKTDVEGPSWLNRNGTKDVARRNDLASAAGYWAARDFPGAWAWMKSYKGLDKETCWGRVLHGA